MSYFIENCVLIENKFKGKLISLRIIPYEGYVLRERIEAEDGSISYIYLDGFITINARMIEEELKVLEAVEKEVEE